MNTKIDRDVGAAVFGMCTNSTVVVRVNDDVGVCKAKLTEKIKHKFQCHCLKPADVMTRNFPIRDQRKSVPEIPYNNTNTPRS